MFNKNSDKYSPNKSYSDNNLTADNENGELHESQNASVPLNPPKYTPIPESSEKIDVDDAAEVSTSGGCCHKYSNALKVCIPWRPAAKDKKKLPSNKAGLINYFSLAWLTGLMWKAFRFGLDKDDIWEIQDEDSASVMCRRLERLWEEEQRTAKQKGAEPLFYKAVFKGIRTRVLVTIFISTFVVTLQFLGPSVFLKLILDYINDSRVDHIYGVYILVAMFVLNFTRGAFFSFMFVISSHTATRMTGGLQSLVYRKILKLKTGGEKLSAQVTNILTSDMERLFESVVSSVFLTASPLLFIYTSVYSVWVIGPWALLGLGCYFLLYPVMGAIARAQSRVRLKTVKKTDKRVGLMSEILNSIRLIKMYSWEDSFSEKIAAIRKDELKCHLVGGLFQAVASTTVPSISILATICTFLGYTLTGYALKSSEAFTIFSVFNAMQYTAAVLPYTIRSIAEAKISLGRIQKILLLPEHLKESCGVVQSSTAIGIKNATFAWEIHSIDEKKPPPVPKESKKKKKEKPTKDDIEITKGLLIEEKKQNDTKDPCCDDKKNASPTKQNPVTHFNENGVEISEILNGINLTINKGSLIGVCGSVGSGKSSLVSAICGDMKLRSGNLQVNGRLAIVSQEAWIYNATLRENIIIGQEYDEERYAEVIRVCSLKPDVEMLPNGDLTEIGERGVNLSGGQKQRVNVARAVYSNRDIYLLDDPLSAVDTKVANQLFNRCIRGQLKDKTVILVTHATHFLERCDEVIMMKEGRICERGTHQALVDRMGQYYDMVSFSSHSEAGSTPEEVEVERKRKESVRKNSIRSVTESLDEELKSDGKLIKEETKEVGSVSSKVYSDFIKACGGCCRFFVVLAVIGIFTLSRLFNLVWLQQWLDAGDGLESERRENETLYNVTYSDEELKGDITKNPKLELYQLVYGLSFFMLIIAGLFKGLGVTYSVLVGASRLHSQMFCRILRAPMSFFDTTPVGRILNRFSRDMDEVDVRIPFFLEFVLQGLMSICGQIILACVIFPIFLAPLLVIAVVFVFIDYILNSGIREMKRLDSTFKSFVIQQLGASITGLSIIRTFDREHIFIERFDHFLDKQSAAQLVFRLSSRWFTYRMDLMAILVTTAITVICIFTKGHFSTAIAGLALTSINSVCGFIPFFMRMKSELMSRMTSVERIIEYAQDIESEAPRDLPEKEPQSSWPSTGVIELKDVKLRYRPELPLVLHGISAYIKPAEKVGIVGRTGAGKTSLISTLLRIVELDSGSILIDSIDISTIGLRALRSAISVIPQDPILFQGTIRYNLDPFEKHSDDEVWQALERAHLKQKICSLTLKLQSEVEAAGENFSVGEKQLICLARALLRKSKILLLDEATASVDIETDHLIQETVKEAFGHCTVITIAHRLNTVSNYDRVLVLDLGVVKEFDSPAILMNTDRSVFKDMMKAMGVTDIEQLNKKNST